MAASNSVNGLATQVSKWLEETSVGRSIYDDSVRSVDLYELDPKYGNYKRSDSLPAVDRRDIVRKVRALGAR